MSDRPPERRPFVLALAVLGTEIFALHINPTRDDDGGPQREIDTGALIEHAPPQGIGFHIPQRDTDPEWQDQE